MTVTIDPTFAESLLRTFDDPNDVPVYLLFNQFWNHAPTEVVESYARQFIDDKEIAAFVRDAHYPEPVSLSTLAACAEGTYGRALHAFIVDNGLEANLATNYRQFHTAIEEAGMLDGMPSNMRYAVLRGFQLHDYIHVLTGYGPTPRDELALQAFCLAQLQFPYFAIWISVVTTRMTFIDPSAIVGIMDAITEGWTFGRTAPNLQLHRWEEHLDEDLVDLRRAFGIADEGKRVSDARRTLAAPVAT